METKCVRILKEASGIVHLTIPLRILAKLPSQHIPNQSANVADQARCNADVLNLSDQPVIIIVTIYKSWLTVAVSFIDTCHLPLPRQLTCHQPVPIYLPLTVANLLAACRCPCCLQLAACPCPSCLPLVSLGLGASGSSHMGAPIWSSHV